MSEGLSHHTPQDPDEPFPSTTQGVRALTPFDIRAPAEVLYCKGLNVLINSKKHMKSIPLPLWHCGAGPITFHVGPASRVNPSEWGELTLEAMKDTFCLSPSVSLVTGLEPGSR